MEQEDHSGRKSTALVWGFTLLSVLILVLWLTGGFEAIFTGPESDKDMMTTEEKMPGTEREPLPEATPTEKPVAGRGKYATTVNVAGTKYYTNTEVPPAVIGGSEVIIERLQYPPAAKKAGIEGKVFIKTYIDELGNVTHTEVTQGIGMGCDEAARDAVGDTKFTPGQIGVQTVKSVVTVPVLFKLKPDA